MGTLWANSKIKALILTSVSAVKICGQPKGHRRTTECPVSRFCAQQPSVCLTASSARLPQKSACSRASHCSAWRLHCHEKIATNPQKWVWVKIKPGIGPSFGPCFHRVPFGGYPLPYVLTTNAKCVHTHQISMETAPGTPEPPQNQEPSEGQAALLPIGEISPSP